MQLLQNNKNNNDNNNNNNNNNNSNNNNNNNNLRLSPENIFVLEVGVELLALVNVVPPISSVFCTSLRTIQE